MSRVNYETVAKACETLVSSGKKPSVRLIIDCLGGGSPNTVISFQRQWKSTQPIQDVPEVVKTSLSTKMSDLESKLNEALLRVEVLESKIEKYFDGVSKGSVRPVAPTIRNEEELKKFVGMLAKTTNINWLELKAHYGDILVDCDLKAVQSRFKNTRTDFRKKDNVKSVVNLSAT